MAIHVAQIGMVTINAVGTPKPRVTMTIGEAATSSSEQRILADSTLPNTANYPTISAYLTLEDAAGYALQHIDQTYCITGNTSGAVIPGLAFTDVPIVQTVAGTTALFTGAGWLVLLLGTMNSAGTIQLQNTAGTAITGPMVLAAGINHNSNVPVAIYSAAGMKLVSTTAGFNGCAKVAQ